MSRTLILLIGLSAAAIGAQAQASTSATQHEAIDSAGSFTVLVAKTRRELTGSTLP